MALSSDERSQLREMFQGLASDPNGSSPIYSVIGSAVADNYPTLDLFETVTPEKRRPMTLFAAVHYLILKGEKHRLTDVYNAPELKSSLDNAGRAFIEFCDEYSDEIIHVMNHRDVQTNEVNRCIGLLPALMEASRSTKRRLALVELGASAGLNLLFDRFRYDFGGAVVGPPGSHVRLSTQLRGSGPMLESTPPIVDYRVGIDTDPIDINDEDEAMWLAACVWVGEVAREQRLDGALTLARREWPEVREGNALVELPRIAENIDDDLTLCIFNSWMMGWLSPDDQTKLSEIIRSIATYRDVWWISIEGAGQVPGLPEVGEIPWDASVLGLQHLSSGVEDSRVLALIQHHGAWIEWRDPATTA